MNRIEWSALDRALVVGIVVGGCACAETRAGPGPVEPATAPAAGSVTGEASAPGCEPARGRPAAGEAAVEDRPDGTEVLVRYSATPRDAPCETLDILARLRGEMLLGEPGAEVEVVWSTERAIGEDAAMTLVVGTATVALPSEWKRRGSRVELTARAPAAALASYCSQRRPTIVISGRRIELSDRQAGHLRRFVRRLPSHHLVRPRQAVYREGGGIARERQTEADAASGKGWFCVEAPGADRVKERTSSCHRTAAECEESRAAIRATGSPVGDCTGSSSAACYSWRAATGSGRACFYRPSHCSRDETSRRESEEAPVQTSSCRPVQ